MKHEPETSDGWVEWGGGYPASVDPETVVEVRLRDGAEAAGAAGTWWWGRKDGAAGEIIAYRVVRKEPHHEEVDRVFGAALSGTVALSNTGTLYTPLIPSRTPLDHQVGGDHYKGGPIQPVEFIQANGLGFIEGSVVKYVTRWRRKGGLQDLEKARHYLDLLIELETKSK